MSKTISTVIIGALSVVIILSLAVLAVAPANARYTDLPVGRAFIAGADTEVRSPFMSKDGMNVFYGSANSDFEITLPISISGGEAECRLSVVSQSEYISYVNFSSDYFYLGGENGNEKEITVFASVNSSKLSGQTSAVDANIEIALAYNGTETMSSEFTVRLNPRETAYGTPEEHTLFDSEACAELSKGMLLLKFSDIPASPIRARLVSLPARTVIYSSTSSTALYEGGNAAISIGAGYLLLDVSQTELFGSEEYTFTVQTECFEGGEIRTYIDTVTVSADAPEELLVPSVSGGVPVMKNGTLVYTIAETDFLRDMNWNGFTAGSNSELHFSFEKLSGERWIAFDPAANGIAVTYLSPVAVDETEVANGNITLYTTDPDANIGTYRIIARIEYKGIKIYERSLPFFITG